MPGTFFLFGLTGYTATRLADALHAEGWRVTGTTRDSFAGREADLAAATHILSSVPPGETDPVLDAYRDTLAASRAWLGYLSSTGVYGDVQGAWVDESAPTGSGRRTARAAADAEWLALGARVFRLPGIYGPGRSARCRRDCGTRTSGSWAVARPDCRARCRRVPGSSGRKPGARRRGGWRT